MKDFIIFTLIAYLIYRDYIQRKINLANVESLESLLDNQNKMSDLLKSLAETVANILKSKLK